VEAILDSLQWLGLDWDEGPYFQSQRLPIYREIAHGLVEQGHAYLCYCSPERLEAVRREQVQRKQPPKYDRYCRDLPQQEKARLERTGIVPVIRFKTPLEGETSFLDLIRGWVTFKNETLDDFVMLKSDGYPTYHLASVVDDHLMNISHVLRADEWLSSTPRHVLLYRALGWQPPQFAHLPMILGPDRAKLSKRHGAASIKEYQEQGYLPEALVNFLALLGWSLDDRTELMSRDELIAHFSLERVGKTAAVFNKEKLDWMNGVYLRRLSRDEFVRRAMPFLERGLPRLVECPPDRNYVAQVLSLAQERVKTLSEVSEFCSFFFVDKLEYDVDLLTRELDVESACNALKVAQDRLEQVENWDATTLESILRPLASDLNLSTGRFFGLLRVAFTGRAAAPPLFQTMAVMGKSRCLGRLNAALERLATLCR
jgi:glutamyl-tRNA synthetase